MILLTIILLTGFFTNLPNAVLGAVVIDAGISLIKFREFHHYRVSNRDFAAFMATALAVFFVGVLAGVVAGVAIALLLLIVSSSKSPTLQMAYDRENGIYVHVDHHPEAELIPGIVVVGIHGPLFFADAENFRASVAAFVSTNQPHTVVIDLSAVIMMDMDGVKALDKVVDELRQKEISVLLVNVGTDNTQLMRRTGTFRNRLRDPLPYGKCRRDECTRSKPSRMTPCHHSHVGGRRGSARTFAARGPANPSNLHAIRRCRNRTEAVRRVASPLATTTAVRASAAVTHIRGRAVRRMPMGV